MIRAGDYLRLARGLPTLRLEELTAAGAWSWSPRTQMTKASAVAA